MQLEGKPMEVEVVNLIASPLLQTLQATEATVTCKFVVIGHDHRLSLVLGPVSVFPYHANLVGQFCQNKLLEYRWEKQPDVVKIGDSGYRILGGGHLELNFAKMKAKFSGSSKAYGYYDLDAVRRIVSSDPFFAEFSVQIDS